MFVWVKLGGGGGGGGGLLNLPQPMIFLTVCFLLHYREGDLEFVKYLITEWKCNPQCTDKDGRTPLHLACR